MEKDLSTREAHRIRGAQDPDPRQVAAAAGGTRLGTSGACSDVRGHSGLATQEFRLEPSVPDV